MSDTMYGYKVRIWQSVLHNGKHSHNNRRVKTVHLPVMTHNQLKLRRMVRPLVDIKPASETKVHDGLTITVDEEFIYTVEYLGRAEARIVYDYVKE